jgi:hypothetical protein
MSGSRPCLRYHGGTRLDGGRVENSSPARPRVGDVDVADAHRTAALVARDAQPDRVRAPLRRQPGRRSSKLTARNPGHTRRRSLPPLASRRDDQRRHDGRTWHTGAAVQVRNHAARNGQTGPAAPFNGLVNPVDGDERTAHGGVSCVRCGVSVRRHRWTGNGRSTPSRSVSKRRWRARGGSFFDGPAGRARSW